MGAFAKIHTILYVRDQEISKDFYEKLLQMEATLHVPGMTEFRITETFTLGLMPNSGIARILEDRTPHPDTGTGIPRCELYLYTEEIEEAWSRIQELQLPVISALSQRNWGDIACYTADPDGHIIAFAKSVN